MNKISARQILLFLACIAPVGKLVLLPARLADASQNDLLFPFLLHILVQTGAVFCVLLAAKKETDLMGLLRNTFGKGAAFVLTALFSLFLLFSALLPLLEQKHFVQGAFYDTLPSVLVFSPFFLFAAYLCSKPLGSCGRVWDIVAPLAAAGLVGILILSAGSADLTALSPAGAAGGRGFLQGVRSACGWFCDAALLVPLLGKIEYKRGLAWKGAVCYLAGGAAALLFTAVFYGIFQETAINQLFAFTATSKYFAGVTTLGRIDYLFIFLLSLSMAYYVSLPLHGSVDCLLQLFGRRKHLPAILSAAVALLFTVITLSLDYRFGDVLSLLTGSLFWLFPLFSVLLPPLTLFLRRDRRA